MTDATARDSPLGEVVARNVIAARTALGLSQANLAARAGVSRATVNMIENGTCDPRISTIATLAAALSTSPLLLMLQSPELVRFGEQAAEARQVRANVARTLTTETSAAMDQLRGSQLPRNRARAVEMARVGANDAGLAAGGVVGGAIGAMLGGPVGFAVGAALGALIGSTPTKPIASKAAEKLPRTSPNRNASPKVVRPSTRRR